MHQDIFGAGFAPDQAVVEYSCHTPMITETKSQCYNYITLFIIFTSIHFYVHAARVCVTM